MESNALTVIPDTQHFDIQREQSFVQALKRADEATKIEPIRAPAQIYLDEQAHIRGGYRFTSDALMQLCSNIAPGLWKLMLNISGIRRRLNDTDDVCSVAAACDIFNTCVRVRFKIGVGFSNSNLIINTREKIVEGVVGQNYQYFPNFELYHQTNSVVQSLPGQNRFEEAHLAGRRMFLFYKNHAGTITAPWDESETFQRGSYFANSEAGECSVRALGVLYRNQTGHRCLIPSDRGMRQVHAGKDFGKKIEKLLRDALVGAISSDTIRRQLDDIRQRPLGFGPGGTEERNERIAHIVAALASRKLMNREAIKVAVRWATFVGAHGDTFPSKVRAQDLEHRNEFDLFCSIMRQAEELLIDRRETAERLSSEILMNNVTLS